MTGVDEPSEVLEENIMSQTAWRLKGEWLKCCNCNYGCPCDFNARPTHDLCKGLVAMHVTSGNFGKVKLDGVKFAATDIAALLAPLPEPERP